MLLFLTLLPIPLQILAGDEWLIRAYRISEGLPQNCITAWVQTADGHIWVGTEMGLARFNGTDFSVWNRWNTPQLPNNRITVLTEDQSGKLWVGTAGGGCGCWQNGTWQVPLPRNKLPDGHIHAILATRNDELWLGSDAGLFRLQGKAISIFQRSAGLPGNVVHGLLRDRSGNIWAVCESSLVKCLPAIRGKVSFLPIIDGSITTWTLDQQGNVWAATKNALYRLGPRGEVLPISSPYPQGTRISALLQDRRGRFWFGTFGDGVYYQENGKLLHIGYGEGLSDEFITTLNEDKEGNIWIGTQTGGLHLATARSIHWYSSEQGLPENQVTTLLEDGQGNLWVGTRHRGLICFRGGIAARRWVTIPGIVNERILSLCLSRQGELWVGTENGLHIIQDEKVRTSVSIGKGPLREVLALCQDSAGAMWIGTATGLCTWPPDRRSSGTDNQLSQMPIHALSEDAGGNLWVGTEDGLYRGRNGTFQRLFPAGNLASEAVLTVTPSAVDTGLIWFGTRGGGLFRLQGGAVNRFSTKDGLPSNIILSSQEISGNLWLSSPQGICRLAVASLPLPGKRFPLSLIRYAEADGFRSAECSGETQPASWHSQQGQLYFPTSQGIAMLDLGQLPRNPQVPPVTIEGIWIDNQPAQSRQQVSLPSGEHLFEFHFAALSFSAPEKNRLRYRLEGYDTDWREVTVPQHNTALYYNLRPGGYRFRVIGSNNDEVWNLQGDSFSFRIRHGFNPLWLVAPLLLLILLTGIVLHRRQPVAILARPTKKYLTSALTPDRAEEIALKLQAAMETEKVFLDPTMTLKKLSAKLMVHPNHLSQIINETYRQNYNDFINRFRIETAKAKLSNPREAKKSILDITYEVGFYSKSVFNTAFKKFTGLTPSAFRRRPPADDH